MRAWIEAGFEQEHVQQASVGELFDKLSERPFILDVRSQGEWNSGHIEGAVHIQGGELPKRLGEIPRDTTLHVVCGSGYRSSIATSVLKGSVLNSIINVAGGMGAWNAQKLPTESNLAACPLGT